LSLHHDAQIAGCVVVEITIAAIAGNVIRTTYTAAFAVTTIGANCDTCRVKAC